jgi:hypothetical protein
MPFSVSALNVPSLSRRFVGDNTTREKGCKVVYSQLLSLSGTNRGPASLRTLKGGHQT